MWKPTGRGAVFVPRRPRVPHVSVLGCGCGALIKIYTSKNVVFYSGLSQNDQRVSSWNSIDIPHLVCLFFSSLLLSLMLSLPLSCLHQVQHLRRALLRVLCAHLAVASTSAQLTAGLRLSSARRRRGNHSKTDWQRKGALRVCTCILKCMYTSYWICSSLHEPSISWTHALIHCTLFLKLPPSLPLPPFVRPRAAKYGGQCRTTSGPLAKSPGPR